MKIALRKGHCVAERSSAFVDSKSTFQIFVFLLHKLNLSVYSYDQKVIYSKVLETTNISFMKKILVENTMRKEQKVNHGGWSKCKICYV